MARNGRAVCQKQRDEALVVHGTARAAMPRQDMQWWQHQGLPLEQAAGQVDDLGGVKHRVSPHGWDGGSVAPGSRDLGCCRLGPVRLASAFAFLRARPGAMRRNNQD